MISDCSWLSPASAAVRRLQLEKGFFEMSSVRNRVVAVVLLGQGFLLGGLGLAIGHADDAPGAGMVGIVLFFGFGCAAWRTWRGHFGSLR
jgi:hypothetical protein